MFLRASLSYEACSEYAQPIIDQNSGHVVLSLRLSTHGLLVRGVEVMYEKGEGQKVE